MAVERVEAAHHNEFFDRRDADFEFRDIRDLELGSFLCSFHREVIPDLGQNPTLAAVVREASGYAGLPERFDGPTTAFIRRHNVVPLDQDKRTARVHGAAIYGVAAIAYTIAESSPKEDIIWQGKVGERGIAGETIFRVGENSLKDLFYDPYPLTPDEETKIAVNSLNNISRLLPPTDTGENGLDTPSRALPAVIELVQPKSDNDSLPEEILAYVDEATQEYMKEFYCEAVVAGEMQFPISLGEALEVVSIFSAIEGNDRRDLENGLMYQNLIISDDQPYKDMDEKVLTLADLMTLVKIGKGIEDYRKSFKAGLIPLDDIYIAIIAAEQQRFIEQSTNFSPEELQELDNLITRGTKIDPRTQAVSKDSDIIFMDRVLEAAKKKDKKNDRAKFDSFWWNKSKATLDEAIEVVLFSK